MTLTRNTAHEEPDAAPVRPLPELVADLAHPHAERRREAVVGLLGHPGTAGLLVDRIAQEPDRVVREALGTSLCALAEPGSAELLVRLLASDEPAVRTLAAGTLCLLPGGEQAALAASDSPDPDVRVMASMALIAVPSDVACTRLAEIVDTDDDARVVGTAVSGLLELGAAPAALLQAAARRFPDDPFLPFAARSAPGGTG